jgi:uncharacterized ferritin-like protein (DUF455 family)
VSGCEEAKSVMTYFEFAQRVLFGTSLEDKLVSPLSVQGVSESIAQQKLFAFASNSNIVPGRPAQLRLDNWETSAKIPFPTLSQMQDPFMRGRVMHFFANHELLALELMALILLRFPDLPLPFKRSLVQTMKEEQAHLRSYVSQMKRFGVEFGDIPLNDFFWRILSEVKTPGQFLAGMSLTFEQANLDFALMFRDAFLTVGDAECAKIMNDVFEDEIGHVRLGLAWCRAWNVEPDSDWKCYLKFLPEKLSPLRAKAQVFSVEARRKVGFDEDYIKRLMTQGGSKGRPPVVWFFTAGAEMSKSYGTLTKQHLALIDQVEHDLSPLMALVAAPDDCVVTPQIPDLDDCLELTSLGFSIPEFVTPDKVETLSERKLGGLIYWADCPRLRAKYHFLNDSCIAQPPVEKQVQDGNVMFGSKCDSHEILLRAHEIAKADNTYLSALEKWFDLKSLSPVIFDDPFLKANCNGTNIFDTLLRYSCGLESSQEIHDGEQLKTFREFVLKQDHSTSGKDRFICKTVLDIQQAANWAKKRLQSGQRLRCELWMQRKVDFSAQLEVDASQNLVRYVGKGRFLTHSDGQYFGAVIGRQSDGFFPEFLKKLSESNLQRSVWDLLEHFAKSVGAALVERGFVGPVGVDMFLYRDKANGELRLHPCVELNSRWTQGRVALAIQKRVLPQASAVWLQLGRSRFGDFEDLALRLKSAFGFETKLPQILSSGMVSTTSAKTSKAIWTVLLVASNLKELLHKAESAEPKLKELVEKALLVAP